MGTAYLLHAFFFFSRRSNARAPIDAHTPRDTPTAQSFQLGATCRNLTERAIIRQATKTPHTHTQHREHRPHHHQHHCCCRFVRSFGDVEWWAERKRCTQLWLSLISPSTFDKIPTRRSWRCRCWDVIYEYTYIVRIYTPNDAATCPRHIKWKWQRVNGFFCVCVRWWHTQSHGKSHRYLWHLFASNIINHD